MELDEFVETTLLQVMRGVQKAQKTWGADAQNRGTINPAWGKSPALYEYTQTIQFDVAVTAATSKSGEAAGGIKVLSLIDLKGGGTVSADRSVVSRVSFSVPIIPPVITVSDIERPKSP